MNVFLVGNSQKDLEWAKSFIKEHDGVLIERDKVYSNLFKSEPTSGDIIQNELIFDEILYSIFDLMQIKVETIVVSISHLSDAFYTFLIMMRQALDDFPINSLVKILSDGESKDDFTDLGDDLVKVYGLQMGYGEVIGDVPIEMNLFLQSIVIDFYPTSLKDVKFS